MWAGKFEVHLAHRGCCIREVVAQHADGKLTRSPCYKWHALRRCNHPFAVDFVHADRRQFKNGLVCAVT